MDIAVPIGCVSLLALASFVKNHKWQGFLCAFAFLLGIGYSAYLLLIR